MRLRNWLLAGTSVGFMALAPLSAFAQDAELQSAYQAYVSAQASGDAAAIEAAQATLTELCIVGGYGSLGDCIAALNATAPAAEPEAPAEEAAPVEDVAPEPEVVEEAAPEPEVIEEPAPEVETFEEEAPVAEEPAEPEPVVEEPAPEPEAAPVEEIEPEPELAPEVTAEEPAVETFEEPVADEPVAEEPTFEEEPVIDEPVAEEAPVAQEPTADEPVAEDVVTEEAPAAEDVTPADAGAGIDGQLAAQVDAYNAAVAELAAGGDPATIQPRLDAALAQINSICSVFGYSDAESCVAEFGLSLDPVPELGAPTDQPPLSEPVAGEPVVEEVTPDGLLAEPVEELPEGVTAEQIAPVFDSAKEAEVTVEGEAAAPAPEAPAVEAEAEPAVLPTSDVEAQSEEIRTLAIEPAALAQEQGTAIEATGTTTVNQTVVNNYVNNITNNVTNIDNSTTIDNSTNVTQNNIGQQNNVTVVEAPTVQTSTGEAITQVILQVGTQLIVNSIGQDTDRFYNPDQDEIYYEELSNGRTREVITRPDGTQIVTVRNRNGDVLQRTRITPDGQEYVLAYFDERYDDQLVGWVDPGQDLPPLRLNIPVQEYVLDARYADEQEVETFFAQPPVEQVARLYSIDEVKRSARVRDSVRKLEVGNLTFDTGAATIGRDQVQGLSSVANAMLALLERNPNETFLIEGHTDAVGSDISNLRLSDLRAATIARVLTDFYGVPPENLATQGYGERYLKIRTEAAERENRRVTIRRITPLITVASN